MQRVNGYLLAGLLSVAVSAATHPPQTGQLKQSTKPTLTSISPTNCAAGAPTFTMTLVGSNFVSGVLVQWVGTVNHMSIPTTYLGGTQLQASIPYSLLTAADSVQVSVSASTKGGGTSNAIVFTVNPSSTPPPSTPLTISTTSVPTGTQGTAYSATLSATGGTTPYSWGVSSGSLPSGVLLGTTGAISGTPSVSGSFSFTARVTDAAAHTATYTYALTIGASTSTTVSISTASPLPNGTVSTAYNTSFAATGGTSPYTWAIASGSGLPAGLTLSSAGALSGTPTAASTYSFSIQVKDSLSNTATKAYSLTVSTGTSAHKVALGWTAPAVFSGVTITGYNVYRLDITSTATPTTCPTPSSTANFTKVGNTTALTYTDSAVAGGHIYCYYSTALAGTAESGPSNISAPAKVPSP